MRPRSHLTLDPTLILHLSGLQYELVCYKAYQNSNKITPTSPEGMVVVSDNRQILLHDDETNEALGVAGRKARVAVPGYGGRRVENGGVPVRLLAPGYSGSGKSRARGRIAVAGYGAAPVALQIDQFPNF